MQLPPAPLFRNRHAAGRALALPVGVSGIAPDALVLAVPCGGVPVGFEVARALSADLDLILVRKLGMPDNEELAIGAIASGGRRVLNHALMASYKLSPGIIESITNRERRELDRREHSYRHGRPPADIQGRTVIVVDDGLATGATMRAACSALRTMNPRSIVVAVPVGSEPACDKLRAEVEAVICLFTLKKFGSLSQWYEDFPQTSDEEVRELLALATRSISDNAER